MHAPAVPPGDSWRFFVRAFPPPLLPLMRSLRPALAVGSWLFLGGLASLQAENLVSIRTEAVPSLPGAMNISRVLAVDGRLVAIADGGSWLLDGSSGKWERHEWRPDGWVQASVSDGRQAFLLLAANPGGGGGGR